MHCIPSKAIVDIYKYIFLPFAILLFLSGSFGFFIQLLAKNKITASIPGLAVCVFNTFLLMYVRQKMAVLHIHSYGLQCSEEIINWFQINKIHYFTFCSPHFMIVRYVDKDKTKKVVITILPLFKTDIIKHQMREHGFKR